MGMEFLAKNGIIHGDLATRNILLSCDLVAKLSDFGLSGRLPMGKQSIELTTTKCPIRWMAPESFRQRILTKATDIWSYGVVLWEIFALAERPYEGKKNRLKPKRFLFCNFDQKIVPIRAKAHFLFIFPWVT